MLLSATNRIAQSLDINHLGPDSGLIRDPVAREIKKRVWWFLIKQDWSKFSLGFVCRSLAFRFWMGEQATMARYIVFESAEKKH